VASSLVSVVAPDPPFSFVTNMTMGVIAAGVFGVGVGVFALGAMRM